MNKDLKELMNNISIYNIFAEFLLFKLKILVFKGQNWSKFWLLKVKTEII